MFRRVRLFNLLCPTFYILSFRFLNRLFCLCASRSLFQMKNLSYFLQKNCSFFLKSSSLGRNGSLKRMISFQTFFLLGLIFLLIITIISSIVNIIIIPLTMFKVVSILIVTINLAFVTPAQICFFDKILTYSHQSGILS